MTPINDGMVELFYNGGRYLVKQSNIFNKEGGLARGIILLPNGVAFDLSRLTYTESDENGNQLERPRLLQGPDCFPNLAFISIIHGIKA